ncbi:hypothetical protein F511_04993 [Dorcoceras hygrometricum]|uniref:RNase H type-1 domain-containing protein n=1 Tax=Dorcoceras hygrometricum TaxID=472368 RepID=A0A2Z7AMZ2_9LAMI|nr:hypothetical protein F511_04993 [Dorcoceras hygrometricum]
MHIRPAHSFVKCNVDAAFFSGEQKLGVGCILQNDEGMFMRCRTCAFNALVSVKEG